MPKTIEQRWNDVLEDEFYILGLWLKHYEGLALDAYQHLQDLQTKQGKRGFRWVKDKDIRRAEAVFEFYVNKANEIDGFIKSEGGNPEPEHLEEIGWYPESNEDHEDYLPQ